MYELLLSDYAFDKVLLLTEFRISATHIIGELLHEAAKERFIESEERIAVTHCPSEDSADDISRFHVGWQLTVGDRETDGTDMVSDDSHRHFRIL